MRKPTTPKTQGRKSSQSVKNRGFKMFCEQQPLTAIANVLGYSTATVGKWAKGKSRTNPSGDKNGPWRERRVAMLMEAQAAGVDHAAPTRHRAEQAVVEAVAEVSNNVIDFGAKRDRRSILEDCKDIRVQLRKAIERLVEHDDFRPMGSVATAFERIARLEIELDPATPGEWVKTAVERGWDVPALAEAIVEERRLG